MPGMWIGILIRFLTQESSIWMYQADHAVKHGNMKAGPNPALRILYYRLVALLALPLRIVFVEDGPERLEVKRDTHVLTRGHPLTPQFRELVRQFGYHCHVVYALPLCNVYRD